MNTKSDNTSNDYEKEKNQKIWRYVDLSKFIHMLSTKKLFFCNLNQFEDKLEGEIPFPKEFGYSSEPRNGTEFGKIMMNLMKHTVLNHFGKQDVSQLKKYILVNCWHVNENESSMMWKSYTSKYPGIAIQSTTEKLEESLRSTNEKFLIRRVKYRDYSKEILDSVNLIEQFITKRIEFSSERELRIITSYSNNLFEKIISYDNPLLKPYIDELDLESKKEGFDANLQNGKYISTDLNKMIEKIYVSVSPSYFVENIQSLVNRYELEKEIVVSVI